LISTRLTTHLLINLLLIGILISCYVVIPDSYQSVDNRLRDFLFINRGAQADSGIIRIVTIDEESLAELGQWPWERNKVARILDNLSAAGAAIIGMDIFFSERDKSSPRYVMQSMDLNQEIFSPAFSKLKLPDYDHLLAETLSRTPTVLGYVFDLKEARNTQQYPKISAAILEQGFSGREFLPQAKGITLNLESLQNNAISSGFLNSKPDASGMIRRVPLLIKYEDVIYTSLAMEIYRLISAIEVLKVHYVATGIESIELLNSNSSLAIATDNEGHLYLNFLGKQKSFMYLKAKDIFNDTFDHSLVANKVILFGATSVGLLDLRATPFDNAMPGVEIHATAIENLLKQNYLHHPDWAVGANVIILLLIYLLLSILYSQLQAHYILMLMIISIYALFYFFNHLLFQQGIILNILLPLTGIILLTITSTVINYYLEHKQRKMLHNSFSRKVSENVVDDILKNKNTDILIAQEKEISILFSDIRNFTKISETLDSPSKLIDLLNIYMTPMVESIMQTQGTVDKFIGDAIMAYWNAPQKVASHADMAILSALQQIQQLARVNRLLQEKYLLSIDIGIGINTGKVTIGEMGSKGRSDYTAIGDAVNLASRLEGLNKTYGSHIIISEFTLKQAQQQYITRELDKVRVKGKNKGIVIYEVLATGQAEGELKQQLEDHNSALSHYYQGEFLLAGAAFDSLLRQYGDIKLYQLYSNRCRTYIDQPPDSFDGIYTFTTK